MIHFTGERVVPGQVNDDLWAEHFCRYVFAAQFARGREVLDIGSGTGYGTAELAKTAQHATGLEISSEAVQYATSKFRGSNLRYTTGSATSLPFANSSFDLVTSFELIEHLDQWKDFLSETRRVLRPDGLFLVSTPNKLYYGESRGTEGPNPYHVHEFDYHEFQNELAVYFPHTRILLQNHVDGFAIHGSTDQEGRAILERTDAEPEQAHFFIAVCSQEALPSIKPFLYIPRAANLLREREQHIRSLEQQLKEERLAREQHVSEVERQLSEEQAARKEHIASLETQIADLHTERTTALQAYKSLEADRDEKLTWAQGLDSELDVARHAIDRAEATVIERTNWVKELENTRWTRLGRKLGFLPASHLAPPKKDS